MASCISHAVMPHPSGTCLSLSRCDMKEMDGIVHTWGEGIEERREGTYSRSSTKRIPTEYSEHDSIVNCLTTESSVMSAPDPSRPQFVVLGVDVRAVCEDSSEEEECRCLPDGVVGGEEDGYTVDYTTIAMPYTTLYSIWHRPGISSQWTEDARLLDSTLLYSTLLSSTL